MLTARSDFRDESGEVTLASLSRPLQPSITALASFLEERVGEFEPEVQDLVRYAISHSGKRLRPLLVFMCGHGEDQPKAELIKAAAVVELVHLATLVHDDILDDAELRHRAPTIFSKYGAHVAVLLGDALFAEALRMAAEFPTTEVCRAVSQATRRVCSGEIKQTFDRGNLNFSIDDYLRVIELKTADLFAVSCFLGGLLSGETRPGFAEAAEIYGRRLGAAYQMLDDIADILGEEARIGKTLGTDLASGKLTLPVIYLLENKSDDEKKQMIGRLSEEMEPVEIQRLFEQSEVLPRVRCMFHSQLEAAEAAIKPFGESPAIGGLYALIEFVRLQLSRFQI